MRTVKDLAFQTESEFTLK